MSVEHSGGDFKTGREAETGNSDFELDGGG